MHASETGVILPFVVAKHDAHIIDGICEWLWGPVADLDTDGVVRHMPEGMVRGGQHVDPQTGDLHTSFLVTQVSLPDELWSGLTPAVERQVAAYYADLDTVCKPVDDPTWGRCFEVDLPVKFAGWSWDDIRNARMRGHV